MPGTSVVALHTTPVLLVLLVFVATCWLLALGHRRALTAGRAATVLVTCLYGTGVLVVTAFPPLLALQPGLHVAALRGLVNVVPLVTIDPRTFVLNVVMTVPLGLLVPLLLRVRSVPAVALVGLLVSAAIESAQGVGDLLLDLGRTVDVNDLVANVAGTVVGLLVLRAVAGVAGPALGRLALPGSALADPDAPQTGPAWFVDDPDDDDRSTSSPLAGASTATTPAASSAVPNVRSPNSA